MIFDWLWTRELSSVLGKTYKVKVHGVRFELRKINPMDFITGSKALLTSFQTYQREDKAATAEQIHQIKRMKEHYADVFLASIVSPMIVRKEEDSGKGIWVENLMTDWDLAEALYAQIMLVTYGKKKMKSILSQKTE